MDAEDIIITKVDNAAFFVEDLFRRTFGQSPPPTPVHYVAFHKRDSSSFEPVGYYHVTHFGECALVGGLCVDERYRNKGLGEKFSSVVFDDIKGKKAFFAYIGNPISERIAHRVGYMNTRQEHLLVRWVQVLTKEEQEKLLAAVIAIGPF